MDSTRFNLNGKVYRRVRDGSPVDYVYVTKNGHNPDGVYLLDTHREHYFDDYEYTETPDSFTIASNEYPVEFTLRDLTMEDISEKYQNSIRTFKTVEDGERMIERELLASPYKSDEVVPIFSISLSETGEALELLMEDDSGTLFYRSNGEWVEVTSEDDHPTIFDQRFITIQEEDNDAIVSIWDEHQADGEDLFEEDVLPFAAVIQ